ncbi:MAG: alpha/beta fold hydrolase [Kouleothrix sp.]|nr:alpha/beta fold hydrolase [Kouleothrix sp.]
MSTAAQTGAPTRTRSRASRLIARLAAILAVVLLAGYLIISGLAANVLTVPRRQVGSQTPAALSLTYSDVRFPAREDGVEISGWYIPRDGSRNAVVLVHGWNSSRTNEFQGHFVDFAAALHDRGLAVMLIDLRGHGQSADAHFSFGIRERYDVEGAVDWLKGQGFKPGSIGVLGVSMGGAAGIGAAADDPDIGALVEDCSFAEIYPLIQREWGNTTPLPQIFLPSTVLMGRLLFGYAIWDARPVDEIGKIPPRPLLIIHGSADAFTPVEHGRQLHAAAPSAEYWEVPGADHAHSYAANPQAYVDRVAGFFERSLK